MGKVTGKQTVSSLDTQSLFADHFRFENLRAKILQAHPSWMLYILRKVTTST